MDWDYWPTVRVKTRKGIADFCATVRNQFHRFCVDEGGQSTTEYVLILGIVVLIVLKFKDVFITRMTGATNRMATGIDSVLNELPQ